MKYLLIILLASFPQHKHKFTIAANNSKCCTEFYCADFPKCKAKQILLYDTVTLKYIDPPVKKIIYPGDPRYNHMGKYDLEITGFKKCWCGKVHAGG